MLKKTYQDNSQAGQTLIAIFFVMVIALASGVAISNKYITNLSSTTDTLISSRADAVATAAIERVLRLDNETLLDYIAENSCGSNCTLSITNADGVVETATVTLSLLGSSSDTYFLEVSQATSSEVYLQGFPSNTNIQVCWDSTISPVPALTGYLIYGGDSNIQATPFAYNSVNHSYDNDFSTASPSAGYQNCFSVNSGSTPRSLRLRALYSDVTVAVIPSNNVALPTQGILIEAVGNSLDASRKVSVIKGANSVPILFDYTLLNKSTSEPLSN